MPLFLHVALTHLLSRRRQSTASILGVALGVGFFIGVSALLRGSQQDLVERLVDTAPHIVIKDEFREPPRQPVSHRYQSAAPKAAVELRGLKPRDPVRGIKDAPGIIKALEAEPGLKVAPALNGQVVLQFGTKSVGASVTGIDIDREPAVSTLDDDMIAGEIPDLATAANGIILGWHLSERLGVQRGDTLTATSASGRVLKMKVTGLFRSGVIAIDRSTSFALLRETQVLLERPNVINQIRIRLQDYSQARDSAADIERRFRYRAESWQEANEDFLSLLVVRNIIFYTVVAATLIVAAFGIYNVISTVVFEKIRDIAILKSMGFDPRDIRRIFLAQGALVGLIGMGGGWALGFALINVVGAVKLRLGGIVEFEYLPLDRSPFSYVIAGVFAMVAAVLAAYLPARRAARLNPVDILRGAA